LQGHFVRVILQGHLIDIIDEGGADDDQAPSSPGSREAGPQYEEDDIMDAEYGGALDDEDNMDPFRGTGALDPAMAIMKKN
jgi:hypothetical protein